MKGKISQLRTDRGFGFIKGDDGKEYFFHISGFGNNIKIEDLKPGLQVQCRLEAGERGPRAVDCQVIDKNFRKEVNLKDYLIENALTAPSRLEGYDEFCDNVQAYALRLKGGKVTTSMIRKLYARIIAAEDLMALKLLRPQFAYTAGRNEGNPVLREFMEILDSIVKSMDIEENKDQLKNFKEFMEAIVAYRKFVGGD